MYHILVKYGGIVSFILFFLRRYISNLFRVIVNIWLNINTRLCWRFFVWEKEKHMFDNHTGRTLTGFPRGHIHGSK